MSSIYFWQSGVSPHMLALAEELQHRGHAVTYAAVHGLSPLRMAMGWPNLEKAACRIASIPHKHDAIAIARSSPQEAIHLFQGLRGNSVIFAGLNEVLARSRQAWCMMEKVDERGVGGIARRILYNWLLRRKKKYSIKYLAIGRGMAEWLAQQGAPPTQIFPFAYFLSRSTFPAATTQDQTRLAYVGQFVQRKRVDLLLRTLRDCDPKKYRLSLIGSGPLLPSLKRIAASHPASRDGGIQWHGVRPMPEVIKMISSFDRVVLPSDHDGWGAVLSESLIAGTPVICSDRCGASVVVKSPELGSIFRHGDIADLSRCLQTAICEGPIRHEQRERIRLFSKSLTASCGAVYLEELIAAVQQRLPPPPPPWQTAATKVFKGPTGFSVGTDQARRSRSRSRS